MILCLNTGSVAKLVVVGSEFQTLTTLSAKNWLRTPLYYSVTWRVYMHGLWCITFTLKTPDWLIDWLIESKHGFCSSFHMWLVYDTSRPAVFSIGCTWQATRTRSVHGHAQVSCCAWSCTPCAQMWLIYRVGKNGTTASASAEVRCRTNTGVDAAGRCTADLWARLAVG